MVFRFVPALLWAFPFWIIGNFVIAGLCRWLMVPGRFDYRCDAIRKCSYCLHRNLHFRMAFYVRTKEIRWYFLVLCSTVSLQQLKKHLPPSSWCPAADVLSTQDFVVQSVCKRTTTTMWGWFQESPTSPKLFCPNIERDKRGLD